MEENKMELKKLVDYIETTVTNNLILEYNDEKAYLAIDDIVYSFIDADSLFYTLRIRYSVNGKDGNYLFPAVVGLPEDLSKFSKQDAFALAILITNLTVEVVDGKSEEDDNSIEEDIKYYC
jgi:hypothetical protein